MKPKKHIAEQFALPGVPEPDFAALWRKAKEIRVTDPKSFTTHDLQTRFNLTSEMACAVLDAVIDDPEGHNLEMAEQLTAQYQRAVGGMRNVVLFGAMMLKLQDFITVSARGHGGKFGDKNSGVKAWLARYAPDISRSTAYRFMAVAEAVQAEYKLPAKAEPLGFAAFATAKPEDLPEPLRVKQQELWQNIEGTSQRSWLDKLKPRTVPTAGDITPRDENGNRVVTKPTPEQTLTKITEQTKEWAASLLDGQYLKHDLWRMLEDEENLCLAIQMEEKAAAIRAWLKAPARERAAVTLEELHP